MSAENGRRPIIKTDKVTMIFGGLVALDEVNFEVDRSSITALIGPNGAGKTTFFNCLTGIYTPTMGSITFVPEKTGGGEGQPISIKGLSPDKVTTKGVARTFQNIRLFNNLTVLENVLIGCHCRMKAGLLGALFRDRRTMTEERGMAEYSYPLLDRYGLGAAVNDLAKTCPTALSVGWRLSGLWLPGLSFFCWTSRPPV